MKFKAFVGPLGDDFPSIFPIVAGILLFFGTLAYAAGVVDEKNNYFEVRKASLGLAYILTQKGKLSQGEFKALCDSQAVEYGRSNDVFFYAALVPQCDGVLFYEDFAQSVSTGSYEPQSCNFTKQGETLDLSKVATRNPVVVSYPMAVPCPSAGSYTYGLGTVTVVVWR